MPYDKSDHRYAIRRVTVTQDQYEIIDLGTSTTLDSASKYPDRYLKDAKIIKVGKQEKMIVEDLRELSDVETSLYCSTQFDEEDSND